MEHATNMSRSHPPSPTSPAFSTFGPAISGQLSRSLSSHSQRPHSAAEKSTTRALARTNSPKGSERPVPVADHGTENGDSISRRYSGVSRQESFDPNASQMSLFDFRRSSITFHWENSTESYKDFGSADRWPLEHVANLSLQQKSRARVWASKVNSRNHGFTDKVADKIVKYGTFEEKRAANIEVQNLKKLCHNHIVAFLGYYTKGNHLGILMFPVAAWDLDQFLQFDANAEGRREMIRPWFGCLARTLLFLHRRKSPFKHRDIKPANILIDRSGAVFLTDFGISKEYPNREATITRGDNRFSIKYASPQMVGPDGEQGIESDVFSLGCVFVEMATVLLEKDLEDMYGYIAQQTGADDIEYHRDFEQFTRWAAELQTYVQSESSPDWKKHLVKHGLPMILRMVSESCKRTKTDVDLLDELCKQLDPISPELCRSCAPHKAISKIVPEVEGPAAEISTLQSDSVQDITKMTATTLINGLGLKEVPTVDQPHFPNSPPPRPNPDIATVPSGTVLHDSVGSSKSEASPPPSIILQRQASDLVHHDQSHPIAQLSTHTQQPHYLESIEEGISPAVTQQPPFISPPIDLPNRSKRDSTEMPFLPTAQNLPTTPPGHSEPQHPAIIHPMTDPTSMRSINSRIRVVDTRHKRKRVDSFDDPDNIPGSEVLYYDRAQKTYQVRRKSSIELREGCLWRLPRGVKAKYRVPGGFFQPWKNLSPTTNVKRIFGHSMLTMFIHGRVTGAQLAAFCSHEDDLFPSIDGMIMTGVQE